MDLLISGGVVLAAIVVLSIYAVYLFLVRFAKLTRERLDGDTLMARVNAAVRDRDLELALDACEQHGGPIARTLHAALLRLPYGRQAVEAAFQDASLQEEQRLTRGLRPLATIAQIAPLMGLLGTVTGMIIAFSEISGAGTGNPALLAGGIGQALVTTAAGLIVAIPTLVGQSFLSSRVDMILLEIDRRREELMANVVQAVAARKDREEAPAEAEESGAVRRPAHARSPAEAYATAPAPGTAPTAPTTAPPAPAASPGAAGPASTARMVEPTVVDPASAPRLSPRPAPVGPSIAARTVAPGAREAEPGTGRAASVPLTNPARLRVRRDSDETEA